MDELFAQTEQFFLKRLQLANWGTFSGIHSIDIAAKGHLFVGGSGSGKSTILDAMSVLLTPGRINFNAAARQGEKRSDRSFMSYIRGAWSSEQDSDGKAATRYLRAGSTWSAVALTYESSFGNPLTLLFVGYVRGQSREEQAIRRNYFVIPGQFAMESIADFAASDFNVRLIKKVAPASQTFPSFGPYFDCFSKYFGITDEKVLHLLHKAQSAKNMGDVNFFFREFMLEVPKTYEIAETLIEEFSELNQAYEVVKKVRRQVEVLEAASQASEKRASAQEKSRAHQKLVAAVEDWKNSRLAECLTAALPRQELDLSKLQAQMTEKQTARSNLEEKRDRLKKEHYQSGGEIIEQLQAQKLVAQKAFDSAKRRQAALEEPFKIVEKKLPATGAKFEVLARELRDERDALQTAEAELTQKRDETNVERARSAEQFAALRDEIELMKARPTNIPVKFVALRDELAGKLGLSASDLPFAGELLQILPEQSVWQGACERVLKQLSLSILVADRNYAAFARAVNDRHLGMRLVYNRVTRRQGNREWSQNSVPSKFEIKAGPFREWLEDELASRFDYVCVNDVSEFAHYEKAVTISGQVKHTASRHEKDDRSKVGDKSFWATGFSNTEKRRYMEGQAGDLAQKISGLQKSADALQRDLRALQKKGTAIVTILNTVWEDIDAATPLDKLHSLEKELSELKARSSHLQELTQDIEKTDAEIKACDEEISVLNQKKGRIEGKLEETRSRLKEAQAALGGRELDQAALNELTQRDAEGAKGALTAENVSPRASQMEKQLNSEIAQSEKIAGEAASAMIVQFATFKAQWPAESSEMDATEESASDFFSLLNRLQVDGLPKYEERFRDLLENHAKQNLIDLTHEIENERRQIKSRMKEVNDSLAEVAFNRSEAGDTHLRIAVTERRLPEVVEFREMQSEIMREGIDTRGQAAAEKYFARLAGLVDKLRSDVQQSHGWRERVLDVREHVSFQGIEFNDAGETLEVFASGAGKSGGQRQKLTMTCLVAALRYQLGGTRAQKPKFAPVVMDEAFDKADSEFTDISMRIFKDFGFQPIIATPEKGLFTLEPYMGSFSYVSCRDRKVSSVLSMTPEKVQDMLQGDAAAEGTSEGASDAAGSSR